MIKEIRVFAVLSVVLLLSHSCSMVRKSSEASQKFPAVMELIKTTQSWDGKYLPAYPQGKPEITILRIIIPAGAQLKTHSHPVINAVVLISGQLTVVTKDGKTLRLKAGDPFVELVNTLHYGINPGTVPAELIVFYAGVTNSPITVAEQQ